MKLEVQVLFWQCFCFCGDTFWFWSSVTGSGGAGQEWTLSGQTLGAGGGGQRVVHVIIMLSFTEFKQLSARQN